MSPKFHVKTYVVLALFRFWVVENLLLIQNIRFERKWQVFLTETLFSTVPWFRSLFLKFLDVCITYAEVFRLWYQVFSEDLNLRMSNLGELFKLNYFSKLSWYTARGMPQNMQRLTATATAVLLLPQGNLCVTLPWKYCFAPS